MFLLGSVDFIGMTGQPRLAFLTAVMSAAKMRAASILWVFVSILLHTEVDNILRH